MFSVMGESAMFHTAHCSETSRLPLPAPTHIHPLLIKGNEFTPTGSCCKSFLETQEITVQSETHETCLWETDDENLNNLFRINSVGVDLWNLSVHTAVQLQQEKSTCTHSNVRLHHTNQWDHLLALKWRFSAHILPITPLSAVDCSEKWALCKRRNSDTGAGGAN